MIAKNEQEVTQLKQEILRLQDEISHLRKNQIPFISKHQEDLLLSLFIELSLKFINSPIEHIEEEINLALKKIGEHMQIDRVYIIEYDFQEQQGKYSYEWCNKGIVTFIDKISTIPLEQIPEFMKLQENSSLVTFPLMKGETCLGVLGFDMGKYGDSFNDREFQLFRVFAQMIVNIFDKRGYEQQLIIEKQKAESSEEKLKMMIKNSNDAFVLVNEKGEQFYVSDVSVAETGYTIEELLGPVYNVIYDEDVPLIIQCFEQIMKHPEQIVKVQYRHKHKNGGFIWYESVAQNFLSNPHIRAIIINVRNIDLLKQKETELIQAKNRAEESDRLKSAFLANMSHEIRTPMNGILGFAGLLKEKILSKEIQIEYLEIIEKSGHRMMNIINDIIDISKIESGTMELNMTETNLNEQFDYVYHFFKPEAEEKGIQFQYSIGLITEDSYCVTDREKLVAILINLVKNSLKYTHCGTIEFGYSRDKDQLKIYVKDTGIGIPESQQDIIFERFIQATKPDKQVYQGAGLGLSISKGYIELLGGEITIESIVGKGSTFFITIPFIESKNKTDRKNLFDHDPQFEFHFKNLKVLIADDDFISQQMIKIMLNEYCSEIILASNGKEALEQFKSNRELDFILMDSQMPEMNGIEAIKEIRKMDSCIPIILQTAYTVRDEVEKAFDVGCNGSISKPIQKNELLKMIKETILN